MNLIPAFLTIVLAQVGPSPAKEAVPVRLFSGHSAPVYDVSISPDARLLATASFDGSLKIWNVRDGMERATLSGHRGKVMSVTFSSAGNFLLSGGEDGTARLWDAPRDQAGVLVAQAAPVEAFVLHPASGRLVTAASDGAVLTWELAGDRRGLVLEPRLKGLRALAVGPAGYLVAGAGTDRLVRIWDLTPPAVKSEGKPPTKDLELISRGDKWRLKRGLAAPARGWNKLGFEDAAWESLPSGFGYGTDAEELKTVKTPLKDMQKNSYLSVFVRATFRIDDPAKVRKLTLKMVYDDGFVAYLNGVEVGREAMTGKFPAFNQKAAGTVNNALEKHIDLKPYLDKLKAGENVLAVQGHNANLSSSDFILTPSLDAVLSLPPPPEKKKEGPVQLAGAEGTIRALGFSPDGRHLAAAGDDRSVRIWQLSGRRQVARIQGAAAIGDLAYLDAGTLALAGADGAIVLWKVSDAANPKMLHTLSGHVGAVHSLDWSARAGLLASAGEDGSVRTWNPVSGKEVRRLAGHQGAALSVSFSLDGKLLASGGADKVLRAWDVRDGRDRGGFMNRLPVRALGATSAGSFYAAAAGKSLLSWKIPAEKAVRIFAGSGGFIHAVSCSPDGKTVAAAGQDGKIRTWDAADGEELLLIKAHASTIYTLVFSPDGKWLCSGGQDGMVRLWNVKTGVGVRKFKGHREGVFCLGFSPDGAEIFSGSSDLTIRRWDRSAGKQLSVYEGHGGWVTGLALRPEGGQLLSVDYSGNLLTWNLSDGKLLARRLLKPAVYALPISADGRWLATASPLNSASLLAQ
ncbi:MAG: WD40 repeat domain-containing protein [Planctomycetota bacterium]|nr:WD40 repeat domain-containing protein [Planctomycetota bacterium]